MRFVLSALLLVFTAAEKPITHFNGRTLAGWEGDTEKTWKIEDGCITGGSLDAVVPRNEFL